MLMYLFLRRYQICRWNPQHLFPKRNVQDHPMEQMNPGRMMDDAGNRGRGQIYLPPFAWNHEQLGGLGEALFCCRLSDFQYLQALQLVGVREDCL
jgi:hypothetical protein